MSENQSTTYIEPTREQIEALYKFYELIYSSHFALAKKRTLMTTVLGHEVWSWRVVAITEDAIRAIAKNKFNKPSRMLARDHNQARVETYNKIFNEKMDLETWWDWIWINDETILMTNDEHHKKHNEPISKIYGLNPKLGFFTNAGLVGWQHAKGREGKFIKQLCEEHDIKLRLVSADNS